MRLGQKTKSPASHPQADLGYRKKKVCIVLILHYATRIMDYIFIGFLIGFVAFCSATGLAFIAHVRLNRWETAMRDIDWQVLSELTLDVAKLKKSAQKWQNNENASQKVSHQELLQQALIQHQMQQQQPVRPRIVEK